MRSAIVGSAIVIAVAATVIAIAGRGRERELVRRLAALETRLAAIDHGPLATTAPASLDELAESARVARARRDVIVTNLSNVETIAFKRRDVTRIDVSQGPMENTDRQLDVAINGAGFFRVKTANGVAYTRNGNFFTADTGELVLGTKEGQRLTPTVKVPDNTIDVNISEDGIVEAVSSANQTTQVGQIELVRFINPEGLNPIGPSLYVETPESGAPIRGSPKGDGGLGSLQQSFLEASNIDPLTERVRLTDIERQIEWIDRTLQRYDAPTTSPARLAR